ncbi:NADPH-dependent 2,4-dienoyl-CoA reductase/sulfur reductase-like enzyme [Streptomyces canus]|nr:NADPH-dependent 2,4-dienoyl-CoA reductase/sulfur reductase-like enzyme [Streptomyces canus]
MGDMRAIADRVEIEALRAELTDAVMMRDFERAVSLFTPEGAMRWPHIDKEFVGREEIRAGIEWGQSLWEFFVQNVHPGVIRLDGDTATHLRGPVPGLHPGPRLGAAAPRPQLIRPARRHGVRSRHLARQVDILRARIPETRIPIQRRKQTMAENTEVVVIGGGYAGVMAANRLTQRDDVTVTLINARPDFVERIRLHQPAGGTHKAVNDYRKVLGERVRLVVDTVTRIDATRRRVELASGDTAANDYLIYAVGSGSADPGVPGAAEFAHPIATFEEARRLRSVLDAAPATAPVTVVGAGPTGIETAAELAEAGRTVTLVCGGLLGPYLHPNGRRSLAKRLAGLGVTVSCRARSPSGPPGSACRTWPPAAGSAPTLWAACSPTRP